MNKPLVSIIVPVYNVDKELLDKCLYSLINQTYRHIEIIIVDDGSSPECSQNCDYYAKTKDNIKVHHQSNHGLSFARNVGVKNCKGDWFMFVDGDDWIEDNTIEELLLIANENIDVIIFGTIKDNNSKSFYYKYDDLLNNTSDFYKNDHATLQKEVLTFESNIGDATARLIRKKYVQKYIIKHDEQIRYGVEAIDFNLKLFNDFDHVVFLKKYYYHYTFNPSSITNNSYCKEKMEMNLFGYNQIRNYLNNSNKDLVEYMYYRMVHCIISNGISIFGTQSDKKYRDKVCDFLEFYNKPIIQDTMKNIEIKKLGFKNRVLLFLLKNKMYRTFSFIAKARIIYKKL